MTTTTAVALDPTRPITVALTGLVIPLLLVIKFKVQAMISVLVGTVAIGLIAGMLFGDIISPVSEGIGSTLKGAALLVDLGSVFGSILEISKDAQTLVVTMMKKFSDKETAWALRTTGLVIAMPIFFDAGLIILIPLAFSLTKRIKRPSLFCAIPLLAGLAVGHVFIPPTPGPVLVATILGVDLGWVVMAGIVYSIFAIIVVGPIWDTICGDKYDIPAPEHIANQEDFGESKLPEFGAIVGIILTPLVLIILDSIIKVMPALVSVQPVLGFPGEPFVALAIATVVAVILLGYCYGYGSKGLGKALTKFLGPTGLILLMTARGGVLRFMLQNSGLGDVIDNAISSASPPVVAMVFVVTVLVRISAGSATIAMTVAAGIIAAMSEIAAMSPLYLACVTAAVAEGATVCSHFNGSGLWLMKSLVGLDEKITLRTWTIMKTLMGGTGLVVALVISFLA